MKDLEATLRDLGESLDYPDGSDLPETVAGRLRAEPPPRAGRRRRVRRLVALAAAAVLLLGGAAVAARLALRGVEILPGPAPETLRPAPVGRGLGLGERTTLAEARAAVPFAVETPGALPPPDAVYVDGSVPDGRVSFVYRPGRDLAADPQTGLGLLATELRAGIPDRALVTKLTESGTTVRSVDVDGAPGFWLAGAPHVVFLRGPGGEIREETVRLAGNVLLWQRGEVTYRIEGKLPLHRALEIARSFA